MIALEAWPDAVGRVDFEGSPAFPSHQLELPLSGSDGPHRCVLRGGSLDLSGQILDAGGTPVPHAGVILTSEPRDGMRG